jgi:hypothetical protein
MEGTSIPGQQTGTTHESSENMPIFILRFNNTEDGLKRLRTLPVPAYLVCSVVIFLNVLVLVIGIMEHIDIPIRFAKIKGAQREYLRTCITGTYSRVFPSLRVERKGNRAQSSRLGLLTSRVRTCQYLFYGLIRLRMV